MVARARETPREQKVAPIHIDAVIELASFDEVVMSQLLRLEPCGQDNPGCFGHPHQLHGVSGIGSHWLFDQSVLASGDGLGRDIEMAFRGSGDDDGIDVVHGLGQGRPLYGVGIVSADGGTNLWPPVDDDHARDVGVI